MAIAYHNAGALAADVGDWPVSLDSYMKESKIFEALLAADPGNARAQRDVALACKKLGAVRERMGDRAAALANYRRAVTLDEIRARDVNDREAHLDLSFDYASIGYTLSTTGDTAGALDNYERALAERRRVAAADPHDVNAEDAVARAHLSIGRVLQHAGRLDESIPHLREALEIASRRYAVDAANGSAAERLAHVLSALAEVYAAQASAATDPGQVARRWQDARTASRRALTIWSERAAKGPLSALDTTDRVALVELAAKSDRALARLPDRSTP
jgi:tetratricopeptide (TPR) repeat protein